MPPSPINCNSGGGEEMAAAVPLLVGVPADESQIGFVDERRRLQRLPRLLLRESLRRQRAQFRVDERQQLRGGAAVALVDGAQDAGDIGHGHLG